MFYDIFLNLCQDRGISSYKALKEMGVGMSTATRWKQGTAQPSYKTLQKIADYFGVSVNELLSDNAAGTKKETAEIIDSPEETERRQLLRQAMEMASTLSDDKLRRLIEILKTK